MQQPPRRVSLVAQAAAAIRDALLRGEWPRWLPGEHELARRLHVSRPTVRSALGQLERLKIIRAGQGRRREFIAAAVPSKIAKPRRAVVLLSPTPLHQLPASNVFWMDELREHLDAAGWPLEICESAAAYKRRPIHALEELSGRLNPAGWVLFRSTSEMQRWFADHAPRAVVAGSRHPGVKLPAIGVDYLAGSRHAAGRFAAEGHRHLAIVRPDTQLAGDLESVGGFEAGAVTAVPCALHNGTVRGVCEQLERLYSRRPRPTGLFVFHASYLLTVLGWLQHRGLRVPEDVSVICRDDEPFLEFALPAPARYALNASLFARRISRMVADLVSAGGGAPRQQRIIPVFVKGETIGSAPQ